MTSVIAIVMWSLMMVWVLASGSWLIQRAEMSTGTANESVTSEEAIAGATASMDSAHRWYSTTLAYSRAMNSQLGGMAAP